MDGHAKFRKTFVKKLKKKSKTLKVNKWLKRP